MEDKTKLELAGDDWSGYYRCKKCGHDAVHGGMVLQMYDDNGHVMYEKKYCIRCYILFWETAGIGELELYTTKGDKPSLNS